MLEKFGFKKINFDGSPPTVVVGMSGGVDSSVAAYILKWQGFNVIGLFMKNWEEVSENGVCCAEQDFVDVKRVSEVIGIPYYTVNFSREYMDNVFKIFLDGLKNGITPNPDILCNREVKFDPFLKRAFQIGADYVATGHYARLGYTCYDSINKSENWESDKVEKSKSVQLLKGVDCGKDQSYFLCGVNASQFSRVMFPVGGLLKEQVREIAKQANLVTATKKDSTGICFIGERNFREFLKGYLGNQDGDIKTLDGKVVGRHCGLMYYTLGQRKGLGIGGLSEKTDRWFVVRKDLDNNTLYVSNGECAEMFVREVVAVDFNWINFDNVKVGYRFNCMAKTRYRQPDQECEVEILKNGKVLAVFKKAQRAVTSGQWLALYTGDICLGGGQIVEAM